MTRPVVWLPEADAELKETLARYEGIRAELAQRFAEAVVDTVGRIADDPLHYAVVEKGRRAGVRRFPYGLFFLVEEKRIVVIACFHGRRNPKHWQLR